MQLHFYIVTWQHLPKSPNPKQDEVEEGEGNSLGSCAANEILKESHSATGHYSLNGLKGLKGTKRGDSVGRESSREDCCRHEREKENQRGALLSLSLLPLSVFPCGSGRGALSSFRTPPHSEPSEPFNFTQVEIFKGDDAGNAERSELRKQQFTPDLKNKLAASHLTNII